MSDQRHLEHAARKAAERPGFLAWVFAAYRERESISESDLRAILRCSEAEFLRLCLCGISPQPTEEEIHYTARFGGVDPRALANIIGGVLPSDGKVSTG